MTTIICDRCGADTTAYNINLTASTHGAPLEAPKRSFDLCPTCYDLFIRWISRATAAESK